MIGYLTQGMYIFKWCIPFGIILFAVIEALLFLTKKRQIHKLGKGDLFSLGCELLLSIYFCTILWITGIIGQEYSFHFSDFSIGNLLEVPFVGASLKMVALNCMLFMPYGFLVALVFRKRRFSWWKFVLIGFCTTFAIEFIQSFTGRLAELDDLITNTSGFVAGAFIASGIYSICVATEKKDRLKGLLKIICPIVLLLIAFAGLSTIATGDQEQDERDAYYETYGFSDQKIDSISEFSISYQSATYTADSDTELADNETVWFSWMGNSIENKAASYQLQDQNTAEEFALDSDKIYITVKFDTPQTFKFENNSSWEMSDVTYMMVCINDGTIWYSSNTEYFQHTAVYANPQYPYQADEQLIDEIKSYISAH